MNSDRINGLDFLSLVENGTKVLSSDEDHINELNVFPVPDGDTGTNMKMTIEGGFIGGNQNPNESISIQSKSIARFMILNARGNSGVILSQFFKGVSLGLEEKTTVTVKELAEAFISGSNKAYSVVENPSEGTILTVMREAGLKAYEKIDSKTSLTDYLNTYLSFANESLEETPELLPILKEAGVIDSGAAGFVKIIEGMLYASKGEEISASIKSDNVKKMNNFNADSTLTYGYCTEFILQLQNSKVNIEDFSINIINDFLKKIGNSIVSFKEDDIIKVHVHTFDPGSVLTEFRKYGEYLTVKIENMNVQHDDSSEVKDLMQKQSKKEHKKVAVVAVANGDGVINSFYEMGVDDVISGGQTMNTSTKDFISSFESLDADNILVFPNNSNIMMAAKVAASEYQKAKVFVIPTKTISEGYSAISMLNFDEDNIEEIVAQTNESFRDVKTLEVTFASRDSMINGIKIDKGDFICIYDGMLIASDKNRLNALEKAIDKIDDFSDKQVLTVICGNDVNDDEFNLFKSYVQDKNTFIEAYQIKGNQELYSYIIGVE